jgi:L-ornithine N5-monooxygenase
MGGAGKPPESAIYDLVGVGFGPSNLAVAVALEERAGDDGDLRAIFFERQAEPLWHPGLLLEGTTLQISFLKDLATPRDPRSEFTFLNYLRERGRLQAFINLREFSPTRIEFNDYLQWVADRLRHYARFRSTVERIVLSPPDPRTGEIDLLAVVVRDESGSTRSYLTRNVVIATGGVPFLPPGVSTSPDSATAHSGEFLPFVERRFPDPGGSYRFVVVGSGQSAAEVFDYLLKSYPRSDVTCVMRRWAFKPADDSLFVNEIFRPETTDLFFGLTSQLRRAISAAHRDTNYSAVDLELIRSIYRTLYEDAVCGRTRARILPLHELVSVIDGDAGVELCLRDLTSGRDRVLEADGAVFATGYTRTLPLPLLEAVDPYIECDGDVYRIRRDYSLATRSELTAGIYLQGFAEGTHGLSDTLLSVLAMRSTEILDAILRAQGKRARRRREYFSAYAC